MSESKTPVYSLPDLKAKSDEVLYNYLASLGITPCHRLTDVRLALGYTMVAISGGAFWYERKHGWDATREWMPFAIMAYFALNFVLGYWVMFVERGVVFDGKKDAVDSADDGDNGFEISISTKTEKCNPTYFLDVKVTRKTSSRSSSSSSSSESSSTSVSTLKLSAPFSRWFSEDGTLHPRELQLFLASSIGVIGLADPASARALPLSSATAATTTSGIRYPSTAVPKISAVGAKSDRAQVKPKSSKQEMENALKDADHTFTVTPDNVHAQMERIKDLAKKQQKSGKK